MNASLAAEPAPGFTVQPLPSWLALPHTIHHKLRGGSGTALTPENLTRAASRRAGLPATFPGHVGVALEVLCRSLHDDARLHWFGQKNQQHLMVTGLAELLKVEETFRRQPTLENVKLNPPLIITGLPRSGTTFLHRLLASVEDAVSIPLYRHLFPVPRRFETRLLEATVFFHPWKVANRRYRIDAMHFVRPHLPDECNFGMRLGMRSMIFWAMAPTYRYLRWLLEQDMRETYRLYRRVLILHQLQAPQKRLTLKCPHHLAWLPALYHALPEAHVIQTHRDPIEAVPSECNLILSLQALAVSTLDWQKTVAHNHLKVHTFAERSLAFAQTDAGKQVMHVDYRQLVKNPLGLARQVYQRFGFAWSAQHQAALEAHYANNQQHKHGINRYTLAQFGLDSKAIQADFRNYREYFLRAE